MLSSVLLESYIKSYLLKEQISQSDHELIVAKMKELDSKLSSKRSGLSLDTLDFDPSTIIFLRDGRAVRDMGSERTKPDTVLKRRNVANASKSAKDFKFYKTKSVNDMPSLGFNPVDKLGSEKSFYVEKIEELIDVYKNDDAARWSSIIRLLEDCLILKDAADEVGLKILGAGVFRFVVAIPEADGFVIKIGMSSKGRDDCRKEIDFSDGRSTVKITHQQNFPLIYTRSDNKSWYAIEKAIFFTDKIFTDEATPEESITRREIKDDISTQFTYTMRFLDAVLKEFKLKKLGHSHNTSWKLFRFYLFILFKKDGSYKAAHEEYIDFKESMPNSNFNTAPETIVSNTVFRQKLEKFLKNVAKSAFSLSVKNMMMIDFSDANDNITDTYFKGNYLNKMTKEIGSMFDQAVITDIRDLHTGNMGFKKNNEGKWMLIFTDIDTKT